jgi:hypothetical protein
VKPAELRERREALHVSQAKLSRRACSTAHTATCAREWSPACSECSRRGARGSFGDDQLFCDSRLLQPRTISATTSSSRPVSGPVSARAVQLLSLEPIHLALADG